MDKTGKHLLTCPAPPEEKNCRRRDGDLLCHLHGLPDFLRFPDNARERGIDFTLKIEVISPESPVVKGLFDHYVKMVRSEWFCHKVEGPCLPCCYRILDRSTGREYND